MSVSLEILPKLAQYRLSHLTGATPTSPINLTFSVTNLCQSKCQSCNIWKYYREDKGKLKEELTLEEIGNIFKSVGHVYFFNISGGEPFLRSDLEEIVRLAVTHLTPRVIHCPTNALCPSRVLSGTRKIMEILRDEARPGTLFTIKPSFDGVGEHHDSVRGVKGNFARLMETVEGLKELKREFPALKVGLGTVVSRMNIQRLPEIMDQAERMGVDTYISEVAEKRMEMKNLADDITPGAEEYERAIRPFKERIQSTLGSLKGLLRITQTLRVLYYDLTVKILKEKRQVLPCYAGISNAHLNPYGDLWSCAILAYDHPMGNLRDHGYDFWKVWGSEQAKDVRRYIKAGRCACPLANQSYANLLLDPRSMFQAALSLLPRSFTSWVRSALVPRQSES